MTTAPHGNLRRRDFHPQVQQLASLRPPPQDPRGNPTRYSAYMAVLALRKVAPGGGSFFIASS